ncbi:hypothetical protein BKA57DRAFT_300095 [Linnemannia elongata]|nr:hypothetical protein BKA57DRAFT_300095 [Linnemannia elongata]
MSRWTYNNNGSYPIPLPPSTPTLLLFSTSTPVCSSLLSVQLKVLNKLYPSCILSSPCVPFALSLFPSSILPPTPFAFCGFFHYLHFLFSFLGTSVSKKILHWSCERLFVLLHAYVYSPLWVLVRTTTWPSKGCAVEHRSPIYYYQSRPAPGPRHQPTVPLVPSTSGRQHKHKAVSLTSTQQGTTALN